MVHLREDDTSPVSNISRHATERRLHRRVMEELLSGLSWTQQLEFLMNTIAIIFNDDAPETIDIDALRAAIAFQRHNATNGTVIGNPERS
jgi:hypothetical protein